MMVLQAAIVLAVLWANIYWELTPNPMLATGLGILIALFVAAGVSKLRARLAARQEWQRPR